MFYFMCLYAKVSLSLLPSDPSGGGAGGVCIQHGWCGDNGHHCPGPWLGAVLPGTAAPGSHWLGLLRCKQGHRGWAGGGRYVCTHIGISAVCVYVQFNVCSCTQYSTPTDYLSHTNHANYHTGTHTTPAMCLEGLIKSKTNLYLQHCWLCKSTCLCSSGPMNALLCGSFTWGTVLMLCELALFTCVLCTVHAADSPSHK